MQIDTINLAQRKTATNAQSLKKKQLTRTKQYFRPT